jgi:cell division septal protein FtsQ
VNRGTERAERRRSRIIKIIRLQLAIVFVLAFWRGTQAVHLHTSVRPPFQVENSACRTLLSAAWLTEADVRSIQADAGVEPALYSYFKPDLTELYVAPYARSPWVKRVVDVRPVWPNRVRTFLEIREPLLGVLRNGRDIYLVDARGVRLPGIRARPPDGLSRPFLRLTGVRARPPQAGKSWSRAVREGAAVALDLLTMSEGMRAAARIQTIDVANVGGRGDSLKSEILLTTVAGAVIEWGRSTASPRFRTEPALMDKLKRLNQALLLYPGLAGLDRVKLQYDELTVVEVGSAERLASNAPVR